VARLGGPWGWGVRLESPIALCTISLLLTSGLQPQADEIVPYHNLSSDRPHVLCGPCGQVPHMSQGPCLDSVPSSFRSLKQHSQGSRAHLCQAGCLGAILATEVSSTVAKRSIQHSAFTRSVLSWPVGMGHQYQQPGRHRSVQVRPADISFHRFASGVVSPGKDKAHADLRA
jgi:hypothetical protein